MWSVSLLIPIQRIGLAHKIQCVRAIYLSGLDWLPANEKWASASQGNVFSFTSNYIWKFETVETLQKMHWAAALSTNLLNSFSEPWCLPRFIVCACEQSWACTLISPRWLFPYLICALFFLAQFNRIQARRAMKAESCACVSACV